MSDTWRPTASLSALKARADLYQQIRSFFSEKQYLEIDVPLLGSGGTTDRFIESFQTSSNNRQLYLQTSPEFAMKRLLAAGAGPIYTLTKAFRQEEVGRFHNSEFSILEWYRPDFDDHQLMAEVSDLMSLFFDYDVEKRSYKEIFQARLSINPYSDSVDDIKAKAIDLLEISGLDDEEDRDVWLDVLFSHIIQPELKGKLFFIYDYPQTQSALARVEKNSEGVFVARRFELFVDGVELANGYWELTDPNEQRERFEKDNRQRQALGLPMVNCDTHLIQAMEQGLPDCAGVALGVDRLLMIIASAGHIADVIAFPSDRV